MEELFNVLFVDLGIIPLMVSIIILVLMIVCRKKFKYPSD